MFSAIAELTKEISLLPFIYQKRCKASDLIKNLKENNYKLNISHNSDIDVYINKIITILEYEEDSEKNIIQWCNEIKKHFLNINNLTQPWDLHNMNIGVKIYILALNDSVKMLRSNYI